MGAGWVMTDGVCEGCGGSFGVGTGDGLVVSSKYRCRWLVMGPCIVEIDRIVIRDVQYKFEVIQWTNEEFQGSSANSDGQTDGQTHINTISPLFLRKHIIGTNLLTKFHADQKINVSSRVLTRKNAPPPPPPPPPSGSHVFQPTCISF
ncbi:hypothetical protein DPMN_042374 [Dreissena polymorpha]|uniref:Uncharacterized protein n=1 Tax=Dreissena polymorpha TaxID=45954 RepID=A0A9D4D0W8_DREPO|nr:hypothetical protein DPMN_042374 [Dreissena polymorpha]